MKLSDCLFGPDGEPKKGVYLRLTNRATGEAQITKTAKDGLFTVDLPPGTYHMEKSGPGEAWLDTEMDLDLSYLRD